MRRTILHTLILNAVTTLAAGVVPFVFPGAIPPSPQSGLLSRLRGRADRA